MIEEQLNNFLKKNIKKEGVREGIVIIIDN